jgi:hypothetical protein
MGGIEDRVKTPADLAAQNASERPGLLAVFPYVERDSRAARGWFPALKLLFVVGAAIGAWVLLALVIRSVP